MEDCSFQCRHHLFPLAKGLFKISNLYNFFHGCLFKRKNLSTRFTCNNCSQLLLLLPVPFKPKKILEFFLPFDLCISAKLAMNCKEALSTFWLPWSFLVDSSVGL